MREIVRPDGTVYATVTVDETLLTIQFTNKGYVVNIDAKVIPQLASILKEAEFFKYMNGRHPVDLNEYNEEVHLYLLNRGAEEYAGWTSTFRPHGLRNFKPTIFPGCKPTHFGATIRIFFPTEDDVMLFSIAYGHLIVNTHSRKVNDLIEGNYE